MPSVSYETDSFDIYADQGSQSDEYDALEESFQDGLREFKLQQSRDTDNMDGINDSCCADDGGEGGDLLVSMDADDEEDWVQLQEMIGNEEASMSEIKITGVNKQGTDADIPFETTKKNPDPDLPKKLSFE